MKTQWENQLAGLIEMEMGEICLYNIKHQNNIPCKNIGANSPSCHLSPHLHMHDQSGREYHML